MALVCKRTK